MEREKIIKLIIYIALGIAGALIIVFCRNYVTLNFTAENCDTFANAMIELLKWLIIPCSLVMISFLTLIPFIFDNTRLSTILIGAEFLALAGLAAYFTFYVNANWTPGFFGQIFNIIGYVLSFVWILAWIALIALIPLLIVKLDAVSAGMSFFVIVFSAFLMACSGHLSILAKEKLSYGFLVSFLNIIAAIMPVITAVRLFKSRNDAVTELFDY